MTRVVPGTEMQVAIVEGVAVPIASRSFSYRAECKLAFDGDAI